jgi:hypothetical protein
MRLTMNIETGNGNYALVADLGIYRVNYLTFWTTAGLPPIGQLNRQRGADLFSTIGKAIDFLRDNPSTFVGLAPVVQADYDGAANYLINWRNQCQLHPNAQLTVPVDAPIA